MISKLRLQVSRLWQKAVGRFEAERCLFGLDILSVLVAVAIARPDRASLIAGFGFVLVGACLRLWTVGYRRIPDQFMTVGPYRFVRHPFYLGRWMLIFGMLVASRNAPLILLYIICSSLLLRVIVRNSERQLERSFPHVYLLYKRSVSAFFPQIIPSHIETRWSAAQQGVFSWRLALRSEGYQELYLMIGFLFLFGLYWFGMIYELKLWMRIVVIAFCAGMIVFSIWRRRSPYRMFKEA